MKSMDVYTLLMLLTRINHVHKGVLKAIMVYLKVGMTNVAAQLEE